MWIGLFRALQMEHCKKPVGRQRSQEKTLPALLVVDELASKPNLETTVRFSEIHQPHLGYTFLVAVRENAIRRGRPFQLYYCAHVALDDMNGIQLYGSSSRVVYDNPDIPHGWF